MKTVLFSSLAAGSLLIAAGAVHASDSWSITAGKSASEATGLIANGAKPGKPNIGGGNWNRPKPNIGGNWNGPRPGKPNISWHPRPGYHGIPKNDVYRRPFRGFNLAAWWVQPSFYIPNYTIYGLSAPSNGYYWSRYYDDAVMINNRGYVADYRSGINWDNYPSTYNVAPPQYQQPQYGPAIRPDAQAYEWGGQDAPAYRVESESGVYDGTWTGGYVDADGRAYRGEWEGTYTGDDGQIYEGTYRGTSIGDPVYTPQAPGAPYGVGAVPPPPAPVGYQTGPAYSQPAYAPPSYGPEAPYRVPAGYEDYERCLKSNGVAGGVIGAVIGGIAGNQIAGRGDKLAGTLIGGGVGALAGYGIEKAASKCKNKLPRQPHYQPAPPVAHPPAYVPAPPQPQVYGYGWQGGYYYPAPQVTTVTVTPGYSTTTTTTTEEYVYETVSVPVKKRAVVKKWKPKAKPKPRCTCR